MANHLIQPCLDLHDRRLRLSQIAVVVFAIAVLLAEVVDGIKISDAGRITERRRPRHGLHHVLHLLHVILYVIVHIAHAQLHRLLQSHQRPLPRHAQIIPHDAIRRLAAFDADGFVEQSKRAGLFQQQLLVLGLQQFTRHVSERAVHCGAFPIRQEFVQRIAGLLQAFTRWCRRSGSSCSGCQRRLLRFHESNNCSSLCDGRHPLASALYPCCGGMIAVIDVPLRRSRWMQRF
mmetsp:Transcript_7622/g.20658  ORF Transcript_7622/g.20658 Transcript_7622/m.20658 type:complete len:233 (+) Transcript_7622:697-1395(+)